MVRRRPGCAHQSRGELESRQTEDVSGGVETRRFAKVGEVVFYRVVGEDRPGDEVFIARR